MFYLKQVKQKPGLFCGAQTSWWGQPRQMTPLRFIKHLRPATPSAGARGRVPSWDGARGEAVQLEPRGACPPSRCTASPWSAASPAPAPLCPPGHSHIGATRGESHGNHLQGRVLRAPVPVISASQRQHPTEIKAAFPYRPASTTAWMGLGQPGHRKGTLGAPNATAGAGSPRR